MADESSTTGEDKPITFHVKSSGNAKYTVTLPLSTTAIDLKNQLSTAEYANVPASAQRLIYSGRVLKDEDTLATHHVKEGNTMHLVKSAASNQRQNPASQGPTTTGTTQPPSGVPSNIAAGTGNNPLAGLTGARYAGFTQLPNASMFGPDGGLGPPPTSDDIIAQLQDPNFVQQMNEALQNPAVIDMMIQQNPQLRQMGPGARQLLQSEQFRRMMTDPEAMRQMAQLQRTMGVGSFAGAAGGPQAFPAPGVTTTTDSQNRAAQTTEDQQQQQQQQQTQQPNPFASMMGGMAGAGGNPFASLFDPALMNQGLNPTTNSTNTAGTEPGQQPAQPPNPFAALFNPGLAAAGQQGGLTDLNNPMVQPMMQAMMQNPEMMQQMMTAMAGGPPGADATATNPYGNLFNLLGGAGGFGGAGAGAPPDTRPAEERYATQLGQLNSMGFHDFDRNIQALRRSGGDINGALEWLFSQPGA